MSFRSSTSQPITVKRRAASSTRDVSTDLTAIYNTNRKNYTDRSDSSSNSSITGFYQIGSWKHENPYTKLSSSKDIFNIQNHSSNSNSYFTNVGDNAPGGNVGSYSFESCYNSNPYKNDRHISPYTTSYNNGVTTASFSFNMGPVKKSSLLSLNLFKGSNPYINKISSSPASSYATPISSITSYTTSFVNRSNSLREQERKSRNRTRSRNAAQRSLSASKEKNEGYESGSERSDRLHLASTSNKSFLAPKNASDDVISDNKKGSEEGGDYKALWEAAKVEIEKLKLQLKKKDDEVSEARLELERLANKTSKNSLSENEKRERRAMERKFSEMEEELKLLLKLKTENERLRAENRALTRVVSKLTYSAQTQLSKSTK